MKKSNILSIIWSLAFIFIAIGATFSYFSTMNASSTGAVAAGSGHVGIGLFVTPLFDSKPLIPMNDDDIWKAYDNECIDDNEYGACQAYNVDVVNNGGESDYTGTINFEIGNITNLNYMVLDENDNVYVPKTRINSGTDQTMGNSFTITDGETKNFKLLIWLSNYTRNQDEEDGGGTYSASMTFESVGGYKISGAITGS